LRNWPTLKTLQLSIASIAQINDRMAFNAIAFLYRAPFWAETGSDESGGTCAVAAHDEIRGMSDKKQMPMTQA